MVVISYRMIREFAKKHHASLEALDVWYDIVEKANWSHFHDVKRDFNSVDSVGNDRYVFNVKGNQYRIVALINFNVRTMYILFIGTHAEYDNINASTILFKRK
ncbi:type II toxin-antitoxin system HigB family toxin [Dyadobacter sp. CY323]|uniref:type II toxin-antitoxin system HigB family toxin n=1 Tax=Dyadobacter sp. CY323 TaxID=2907302 RepID=UPI001F3C9D94|nr:type II toxin-antitoxin system HigB family toxin [Dyadobacter sp. CY323]MCE6992847.1 type II toxin-antitoxin system HigB family toxin [Dyadobacter sp. CY323]